MKSYRFLLLLSGLLILGSCSIISPDKQGHYRHLNKVPVNMQSEATFPERIDINDSHVQIELQQAPLTAMMEMPETHTKEKNNNKPASINQWMKKNAPRLQSPVMRARVKALESGDAQNIDPVTLLIWVLVIALILALLSWIIPGLVELFIAILLIVLIVMAIMYLAGSM